jgi:hypothetical protein
MIDIHSCSLYCDRPACIKAQRNQMRDDIEARKFEGLYADLLMQIGNKHPDETRHQTALRYLRNAEKPSGQFAAPKEATKP